eukprot:CAMPEP_0198684446 /NCGR_PEP_ID=MMETSP1468-20131203/12223_1 /TAXON_ID=1461545 /ORGANISM="Mantoniella sp, Strain CCMP1436" /LENGTH=58 /DNA_ID=CAMNT_0044429265 /DNA_START=400 /DNA_END=576 /DNA_ORIENTATION=+
MPHAAPPPVLPVSPRTAPSRCNSRELHELIRDLAGGRRSEGKAAPATPSPAPPHFAPI